MKNTLLTLILGTFALALCGCRIEGSVQVHNTHDSNYRVFINGVQKADVSGYGTTAQYYYNDDTSIEVYAIQTTGYLVYPSEFFATGTIEGGQVITINF